MTHADRIREAERAVVEAAINYTEVRAAVATGGYTPYTMEDVADAATGIRTKTDTLLVLRAATCPTCGGDGEHPDYDCGGTLCPAGCDNGRRMETT